MLSPSPPQKKGGAGKGNWGDEVADSIVGKETAALVDSWGHAKVSVEGDENPKKEKDDKDGKEAAAGAGDKKHEEGAAKEGEKAHEAVRPLSLSLFLFIFPFNSHWRRRKPMRRRRSTRASPSRTT